MTYTQKLQSTLIDTGKSVEKLRDYTPPTIPEIEVLYDKFLQAVDKDDMREMTEASKELITALVKWRVEIL